jgi:hypothetical protein
VDKLSGDFSKPKGRRCDLFPRPGRNHPGFWGQTEREDATTIKIRFPPAPKNSKTSCSFLSVIKR